MACKVNIFFVSHAQIFLFFFSFSFSGMDVSTGANKSMETQSASASFLAENSLHAQETEIAELCRLPINPHCCLAPIYHPTCV